MTPKESSATEKRTLTIALGLNFALFAIGMGAALYGHSAGLMADALDMLADGVGYAIALAAIGRSLKFKTFAAGISGVLLMMLGAGLLVEVVRRYFYGSEPIGQVMISMAILSLVVNSAVLLMLKRYRNGEVHLRAAWKETRADILINISVIASGVLVLVSHSRYPDLIIGLIVSLIVIHEAWEIIEDARAEDV